MPLALEDYFRAIYEDKMLDKISAKKDAYHYTPATRLLEVRREMAEVEQALVAYKEEFKMKMDGLRLRREELEKKELQLRLSFEKFEKFLKENDSKRARALKKAEDERNLKRRKEKDILDLYTETQSMIALRNRLQRDMATHKIFYEYMTRAIETTDEYREMRDILARYDTLYAIREELLLRQQGNFDAMEALRNEHQQFMEMKEEEKLNCNIRLAELQLRKDKALSSVVTNDTRWTELSQTVTQRTIIIGSVLLAIENLHDLVLQYRAEGTVKADEDSAEPKDAAGKLLEVKQFILDLSSIVANYSRMTGQHWPSGEE